MGGEVSRGLSPQSLASPLDTAFLLLLHFCKCVLSSEVFPEQRPKAD